MEYILNILETSLNRYFNSLAQTGYVNDRQCYDLLLFTFLTEFLQEFIVTEEDYQKISRIITCLQQESCMIPYKSYVKAIEASKTYLYNQPIRITEDNITRISQEQNIRLVN